MASVAVGFKAVVQLLLNHNLLIVGFFCLWSLFCNAVLNFLSSSAIISLSKRELSLYFDCILAGVWL